MPGFWSRIVPQRVFFHSLLQSSYTYPVSKDLLASATFNFVNPRHHIVSTDRVSQVIPASATAGLSDEEILSLFTSGFFGGFVFRLESWVLRICGASLLPARYTGFHPASQAVAIRRPSDIPGTRLLPVGSSFFSSFLLVDKHVAEPSDANSSHVDHGFGSDESMFAGCHRFRVTRLPSVAETTGQGEGRDSQIRIDLEHFRCNPQKNVPSWAEHIETFHYIYAKSLFAKGIQALLSR
ncbi:hypothetical protein V1506DRAFT_549854 [Lipomyces tetrasporus]